MSIAQLLRRRPPPGGLPILKIVLAAVLSYLVAKRLVDTPAPILAPLTALLVVSSTVSATLRNSLQRVGSVVAGVLLAVAVSTVMPLRWWSLGLIVLTSLVVGRKLHLGDQLLEVPISGMLVLAVSYQTDVAAWTRVDETLIGALVGVLVSLVTPALYVQPAGDAIGALGTHTADLLRDVAARLSRSWTDDEADGWLSRSRGLTGPVEEARAAVVRSEESLRLNPRRRTVAGAERNLAAALGSLEHTAIHVRVICRSLRELITAAGETAAPTAPIRWALAHLLRSTGDAVEAFGALAAADVAGPAPDTQPLRDAVERARMHANVAAEMLLVDGASERDVWHAHGALLAHCDRLLDEIDPDLGGAEAVGRPDDHPRRRPLTESKALRPLVRAR